MASRALIFVRLLVDSRQKNSFSSYFMHKNGKYNILYMVYSGNEKIVYWEKEAGEWIGMQYIKYVPLN